MKNYTITLPIAGYVVVEVDAETEEEAIEKAFEATADEDKIGEISWEAMEKIVEGNIFNGPVNEIEVEEN